MFPWGWPFSLENAGEFMFTDNIQFCKISVCVLVHKNDYKHIVPNKFYSIHVLWNFTIVLCGIFY